MRTTRKALLGFHLAVALLAPNAIAGGVRIVDPLLGSTSYPTPQAAIDAAPDGAILLIAAGSYPGFTITGKSISLFAVPGATVDIQRAVFVSNLSSSQTVVLSGLYITLDNYDDYLPPVTVTNCLGSVRVESSSLRAYDYDIGWCPGSGWFLNPGAPGALVSGSTRVVFRTCALTGGHGEGLDSGSDCCLCGTAPGGAGLKVAGGDSIVALYDSMLTGGTGGGGECCEGRGGDGLKLDVGTAFASGCTFRGGAGGDSFQAHGLCGGPGGDGVAISGTLPIALIDCASVGGPPGSPHVSCLVHSYPYRGGTIYGIRGPAAHATFPATVISDSRPMSIAFDGWKGDVVTLLQGAQAPPVTAFGPRGPLLVGGDLITRTTLGQAQQNGVQIGRASCRERV